VIITRVGVQFKLPHLRGGSVTVNTKDFGHVKVMQFNVIQDKTAPGIAMITFVAKLGAGIVAAILLN